MPCTQTQRSPRWNLRLQRRAAASEKVEDRFFGPASGARPALGDRTGHYLEAFGWGDAFVLIGLGAFLISAILGATIGKRNSERLMAAANARSGVEEALRSWRLGTVWDFVVLAVVIWAMITKLGA